MKKTLFLDVILFLHFYFTENVFFMSKILKSIGKIRADFSFQQHKFLKSITKSKN